MKRSPSSTRSCAAGGSGPVGTVPVRCRRRARRHPRASTRCRLDGGPTAVPTSSSPITQSVPWPVPTPPPHCSPLPRPSRTSEVRPGGSASSTSRRVPPLLVGVVERLDPGESDGAPCDITDGLADTPALVGWLPQDDGAVMLGALTRPDGCPHGQRSSRGRQRPDPGHGPPGDPAGRLERTCGRHRATRPGPDGPGLRRGFAVDPTQLLRGCSLAARNRTPMSGPMSRRTSRSTRWSSASIGGLLARLRLAHDGSHPRSGPA